MRVSPLGTKSRQLAISLVNREAGVSIMATHQSKQQKETVGRVMHEFKHGELKTSRGRKVKTPKQAIAIGLREAGASKYESESENRKNLRRTKARERRGETSKQRTERSGGGPTRSELYEQAKRRNIPGRSKMSKQELQRALH
jgi:Family of unknown function (DUF6496)